MASSSSTASSAPPSSSSLGASKRALLARLDALASTLSSARSTATATTSIAAAAAVRTAAASGARGSGARGRGVGGTAARGRGGGGRGSASRGRHQWWTAPPTHQWHGWSGAWHHRSPKWMYWPPPRPFSSRGRGGRGRGGRGRGSGVWGHTFSDYASGVPGRSRPSQAASHVTSLIRLHDTVFAVSSNKRSLRRRSLDDATPAASKRLEAQAQAARKVVGPRHRTASTAAALARKRLASAAVAQSRRASQRSKAAKAQPKKSCMFFNLFGHCDKMGKGCPFAHDRSKVAVCRRFLRGTCRAFLTCPFSHVVTPDKMPVCFHFLRGACGRDDCPYLHKKLGANAPVCTDFLKGHCPKGLACDKRHVVEKRQQGQPSATGNSSALVALPEIDAVGYDGGKGNSSDLRPPASFIRYWERVGRKAPML